MKFFSLLYFLFIKNISCFFQKRNIVVDNLKYRDDDWDHGEVEWDFPEKYIIHDKIKYTSLLHDKNVPIEKEIIKIVVENEKKEMNNTDIYLERIYYGIMKTINKEAVNFQEILLNIQNICFVKSDSNEDVSKDFYILLLIYTLKTNYELSKSRETDLLNKLDDKQKYLKTKRIVSSIMLMIFTILCRNVNSAV